MNDLIRASVIDIVRVDEVDNMIEHGLMDSIHDLDDIVEDGKKYWVIIVLQDVWS